MNSQARKADWRCGDETAMMMLGEPTGTGPRRWWIVLWMRLFGLGVGLGAGSELGLGLGLGSGDRSEAEVGLGVGAETETDAE